MLGSRRFYTILLLQSIILFSAVIGIRWEHSVDLNDDYRVLWTINKLPSISQQQLLAHTQQQSYLPHLTEITFEIQVRTLGYIGFGFSPDGQRAGSDIVIGWVDHGQTHFHVSKFLLFHHIHTKNSFIHAKWYLLRTVYVNISFWTKFIEMRKTVKMSKRNFWAVSPNCDFSENCFFFSLHSPSIYALFSDRKTEKCSKLF